MENAEEVSSFSKVSNYQSKNDLGRRRESLAIFKDRNTSINLQHCWIELSYEFDDLLLTGEGAACTEGGTCSRPPAKR